MQGHERREFFRIRDRLSLEFRRISYEDFSRLRDFIQYNSTQIIDKVSELCFLDEREPKGEHEHIFAYMQVINKKLDMIIDFLAKSQVTEIYESVQTEVNISGAGAQFECGMELSKGDYVELKVTVPIFPCPKVTALCEVLRAETVENKLPARFKVALGFLVINEKDRDILINYVFVKERECLRQKIDPTG